MFQFTPKDIAPEDEEFRVEVMTNARQDVETYDKEMLVKIIFETRLELYHANKEYEKLTREKK